MAKILKLQTLPQTFLGICFISLQKVYSQLSVKVLSLRSGCFYGLTCSPGEV